MKFIIIFSLILITICGNCQMGAGVGMVGSNKGYFGGSLLLPYQYKLLNVEAGMNVFVSEKEYSLGYIKAGIGILYKNRTGYERYSSLVASVGWAYIGNSNHTTKNSFIYSAEYRYNFYAYNNKEQIWRVYWFTNAAGTYNRMYFSIGLITSFKSM